MIFLLIIRHGRIDLPRLCWNSSYTLGIFISTTDSLCFPNITQPTNLTSYGTGWKLFNFHFLSRKQHTVSYCNNMISCPCPYGPKRNGGIGIRICPKSRPKSIGFVMICSVYKDCRINWAWMHHVQTHRKDMNISYDCGLYISPCPHHYSLISGYTPIRSPTSILSHAIYPRNYIYIVLNEWNHLSKW